jgi:hypothetical protein
MVPPWNPDAGESSSASGYFCSISSGNKITPVEKDGKADAKMSFQFGREGQLSILPSPYSLHLPSNMRKDVGAEGLSKTEVSTKRYSGYALQEWDTVSLLTLP